MQIFKSCGLNTTVKTNLKAVGFLDVRLPLINNLYQPYRKPISEIVYINKHSKQPNILKELPKAINKQIKDISCNQDIFDATKSPYRQALSKSGFNKELKYNNKDSKGQTRNKEKRKRRRKFM